MIENLYVPEDRKQRTTQDSSLGGPARYSLVYTDQPLEAPFSIDTVASHYSSASDESAIEHPQPRNAASGKNKNHGISAAITSASSFVGCSVWSRLNKQQLNISIFRTVGLGGCLLPVYQWGHRGSLENDDKEKEEITTAISFCLLRNKKYYWVFIRGTESGHLEICDMVLHEEMNYYLPGDTIIQWIPVCSGDNISEVTQDSRITVIHSVSVTPCESYDFCSILVCFCDSTGTLICQLVELQFDKQNPVKLKSTTLLHSATLDATPVVGLVREMKPASSSNQRIAEVFNVNVLLCGALRCGVLRITGSQYPTFEMTLLPIGSRLGQTDFFYDAVMFDPTANTYITSSWWDSTMNYPLSSVPSPITTSYDYSDCRELSNSITVQQQDSPCSENIVTKSRSSIILSTRPKNRLWVSNEFGSVQTTLKLAGQKGLSPAKSASNDASSLGHIGCLFGTDLITWVTPGCQANGPALVDFSVISLESVSISQRLEWPCEPFSAKAFEAPQRQILASYWDNQTRRLTVATLVFEEEVTSNSEHGYNCALHCDHPFPLVPIICVSQITVVSSLLSVLIDQLRLILHFHSIPQKSPVDTWLSPVASWIPSFHRVLSHVISSYFSSHSEACRSANLCVDFPNHSAGSTSSSNRVSPTMPKARPADVPKEHSSTSPFGTLTPSSGRGFSNSQITSSYVTLIDAARANSPPQCHLIETKASPAANVGSEISGGLGAKRDYHSLKPLLQLLHAVIQLDHGSYFGNRLSQTLRFAESVERELVSNAFEGPTLEPATSLFPSPSSEPMVKHLDFQTTGSPLVPYPDFLRWKNLFRQRGRWTDSAEISTDGGAYKNRTSAATLGYIAMKDEAMRLLDSLSHSLKAKRMFNTEVPALDKITAFHKPRSLLDALLDQQLKPCTRHSRDTPAEKTVDRLPRLHFLGNITELFSNRPFYLVDCQQPHLIDDDQLVECIVPTAVTFQSPRARSVVGQMVTLNYVRPLTLKPTFDSWTSSRTATESSPDHSRWESEHPLDANSITENSDHVGFSFMQIYPVQRLSHDTIVTGRESNGTIERIPFLVPNPTPSSNFQDFIGLQDPLPSSDGRATTSRENGKWKTMKFPNCQSSLDSWYHINIRRKVSEPTSLLQKSNELEADNKPITRETGESRRDYSLVPRDFDRSEKQAIEYIRSVKIIRGNSCSELEVCNAIGWLPGILYLTLMHKKKFGSSSVHEWLLNWSMTQLIKRRAGRMTIDSLGLKKSLILCERSKQKRKIQRCSLLPCGSMRQPRARLSIASPCSNKVTDMLSTTDLGTTTLSNHSWIISPFITSIKHQQSTDSSSGSHQVNKTYNVWKSSTAKLPSCSYSWTEQVSTSVLQCLSTSSRKAPSPELSQRDHHDDGSNRLVFRPSWRRSKLRYMGSSWIRRRMRTDNRWEEDVWNSFPDISELVFKAIRKYPHIRRNAFLELMCLTERSRSVINWIFRSVNLTWDHILKHFITSESPKLDQLFVGHHGLWKLFDSYRHLLYILIAAQLQFERHAVLSLHFNLFCIDILRLSILEKVQILSAKQSSEDRKLPFFVRQPVSNYAFCIESNERNRLREIAAVHQRVKQRNGMGRSKRYFPVWKQASILLAYRRGDLSIAKSMMVHLTDAKLPSSILTENIEVLPNQTIVSPFPKR